MKGLCILQWNAGCVGNARDPIKARDDRRRIDQAWTPDYDQVPTAVREFRLVVAKSAVGEGKQLRCMR